jgi:hypothetical protein
MKWRWAVSIVCLVVNMLSVWILWEAVVRPLKSCCPGGWSRNFPAPFYLWEMPIWFWHDLAITLIIISSAVLAWLSLGGKR